MGVSVSETVTIHAPVDVIWRLVSDLPRMGEWSPENEGCAWTHGSTGPADGARFKGRNRNGWRRWSTRGTVLEARPNECLSFEIRVGPTRISRWSYQISSAGEGHDLTERWDDLRPRYFGPIGRIATGVKDRSSHNRDGMKATLAAIKAAAESAPAAHP